MALLGLLLLPTDYRAGAERAHAHSLVQLWVDAADGAIEHHHLHADPGGSRLDPEISTSWFEPSVEVSGSGQSLSVDFERPDVAEYHESAPVSSGAHLLLAVMTVLIAAGPRQAPIAGPGRSLAGHSPRVLLPPPRWTPAAG